jgi:hypothetical protein
MHTNFLSQNLKERDQSRDQGVEGIGVDVNHRVHKMQGIS